MDELKINPCPYCGESTDLLNWKTSPEYKTRICCDKCGAIGPYGESRKEAVRLWNGLSDRVYRKTEGQPPQTGVCEDHSNDFRTKLAERILFTMEFDKRWVSSWDEFIHNSFKIADYFIDQMNRKKP
jgi:Lar family restriction alleviation protein